MSGFYCKCGHRTSTTVYPSPHEGDLKWQTEFEASDAQAMRQLKEYLSALESGEGTDWVKNNMGESYPPETYPAYVVSDIYSNASWNGRIVRQCEACQRLLVQKEYLTSVWTIYQKEDIWDLG